MRLSIKCYREAVILLSKIGFNPQQVWAMSHIELNAWIDSYLLSQGIKQNSHDANTTTYVFPTR